MKIAKDILSFGKGSLWLRGKTGNDANVYMTEACLWTIFKQNTFWIFELSLGGVNAFLLEIS